MSSLLELSTGTFQLGRFTVDLAQRVLLDGDAQVRLGARAFAILEVLIEADGRLVSKNVLLERVWPGTIVEENNLQVNVSAIRRALGDDRHCIITDPGRGYRVVAARKPALSTNLSSSRAADALTDAAPVVRQAPRLPDQHHVIGRENAVLAVHAALNQTRLLTLTGAGGIGKTTVSLVVASEIEKASPGTVSFVEMASMTSDGEIWAALESCFGEAMTTLAENDTRGVAANWSSGEQILVLDNAEHLVADVAQVVERLQTHRPALRVLVTSREPLRIAGEVVFPVEPLDVPASDADDQEILRQSAVHLFMARAHAVGGRAPSDPDEIALVGEICRRLDGIPLAIELAAARIVTFGVRGVHQRLADRLALLSGGYRTALPRHQTLRATFDWSFALLDPSSKALFRRLASFGGFFSLEAMCAVACDADLAVSEVIDGICELASKSLVGVVLDGAVARYRLSESTRAYALDLLNAAGETQSVATRHARYLASRFRQEGTASAVSGFDSERDVQQALDDARNAVDWAFSPEGDAKTGIELSSTLVGVLLKKSAIEECGRRAAQAIQAIGQLPEGTIDPAAEIRIKIALASVLPNLTGPISYASDLWLEAFHFAQRTNDDALLPRVYWGLWNAMLSGGHVFEALRYAKEFERFAIERESQWQRVFATQLIAVAEHCTGRHVHARALLEDSVRHLADHPDDAAQIRRFAVEPLAICYGGLARIRWLQGDIDEAMQLARKAFNLMPPETMEPWFTHVLSVVAVPLALISGDRARAAHYLSILQSQTSLHQFTIWREFGECAAAHLAILEGHADEGLSKLDAAIASLMKRGFRRVITPFIIESALAMIEAGRVTEAIARLIETQAFCQRHGELYFMPEIHRALGVAHHTLAVSHAEGSDARAGSLAKAKAFYTDAINLAHTQGSLMWELRATLRLAHLLQSSAQSEADRDETSRALLALRARFDPRSMVPEVRQLFALTDSDA